MSFELLKKAIIEAEKKNKVNLIRAPGVKKIFKIVFDFIKKKKLICYGGTAINNILPPNEQFYESYEIPDYDFFSTTPMEDAIELSNIYYKHGYKNIEAKSGVHLGTYKVFVDFIPVADITYAEPQFFINMSKECIRRNGILYAPPNFLRMAMYSELSRPDGDVTRWEKVFTRLRLLNKYYPISENCNITPLKPIKNADAIFKILLKIFIANKVVFFGGYAFTIYTKHSFLAQPSFDILSVTPKKVGILAVQELKKNGIIATLLEHEPIEDYIGKKYEINIYGNIVASLYEPIACYNYNTITHNGHKLNVASIETMLSFYLLFLYIGHRHDSQRIVCMCQYLVEKLKDKNVNRFSLKCIGTQKTLRDIFIEKDILYKKYKNNKDDPRFIESFFRYNPSEKRKTMKSFMQRTKKNPMHLNHHGLLDIIGF